MGHVFISYSRGDKRLVHRLTSSLEDAGFAVWIDRDDIPGGARWAGEIVDAIEASVAVLVALSPKSVQSDNVRKEMALAVGAKKLVLPVLIERTTISGDAKLLLADLHQIDLATDFDSGLEYLLKALRPIVQGELDSILADPDMTTAEKIDKWTEVRAGHRERIDILLEEKEQSKAGIESEIGGLEREEKALISDGVEPGSQTLQRLRTKRHDLERKRSELQKECLELRTERVTLIEKRTAELIKSSNEWIRKWDRIVDGVTGKKS